MRGRIQALNAGRSEGVIQADSGDSIHFEFSAVLAYDVAFLAVGRLVTFDLDGRDGSSVVNICLHRTQPSVDAARALRACVIWASNSRMAFVLISSNAPNREKK
jgi:hypothetical protein